MLVFDILFILFLQWLVNEILYIGFFELDKYFVVSNTGKMD